MEVTARSSEKNIQINAFVYVVAVAGFVAVEYSKVLRRIICLYSFPAASYI